MSTEFLYSVILPQGKATYYNTIKYSVSLYGKLSSVWFIDHRTWRPFISHFATFFVRENSTSVVHAQRNCLLLYEELIETWIATVA